MAGFAKTNPSIIKLAVEAQLVSAGVVDSADAIYWLIEGQDPVAKPTGRRDILLLTPTELVDKPKQKGGGKIGLRLELLIEVHLRTAGMLDRVNTWKDWDIDHRTAKETLLQALENFDPVDDAGNSLTIENLRIDTTIQPHKSRLTERWGDSVGTWRCHYLPDLTGVPLG